MAHFLWTQKEDIGPAPRFGHAMCYDSVRQRTFLFGGSGPELFGDSWIWSGELWTQVADTGPSPRRDHAMVFDAARSVALLFGGASERASLGDTWSWDGENWTQVEDTGPAVRSGHAMAFDGSRSRVVLFGGDGATGPLGDTWEWDGNAWTQVEDTGPSPRSHHALAYDLTRQHTILFGGENAQGLGFGDTWEWDGSNWTEIDDIGPSARTRAAAVSTDAQLVLFAGLSGTSANPVPTLFGDSWVFQAGKWSERQDMGPVGRWGHAMVFDTQRRTVVLFGGHVGVTLDDATEVVKDTWEHAETEPPSQPGSGGGGGSSGGGGVNPNSDIAQLVLTPQSAQPGQMVTVQVNLTGPMQATIAIDLAWIVKSRWDALVNGDTPQPNDFNLIGNVTIPPPNVSGTTAFSAPAAGEPIVVCAAENGMIAATAELAM